MPAPSYLLTTAALAATAAVLVACSSSDSQSDGPANATFVSAANASCAEALQAIAPDPFPYPSFDATNPVTTQLPLASKYYDDQPFNHEELGFVKSFGKPKQGGRTWQTFVNLVSAQQSLVAKEISSGKASDKPAFVAAVKQVEALSPKIKTAALAAGLGSSSSCIVLFG